MARARVRMDATDRLLSFLLICGVLVFAPIAVPQAVNKIVEISHHDACRQSGGESYTEQTGIGYPPFEVRCVDRYSDGTSIPRLQRVWPSFVLFAFDLFLLGGFVAHRWWWRVRGPGRARPESLSMSRP